MAVGSGDGVGCVRFALEKLEGALGLARIECCREAAVCGETCVLGKLTTTRGFKDVKDGECAAAELLS